MAEQVMWVPRPGRRVSELFARCDLCKGSGPYIEYNWFRKEGFIQRMAVCRECASDEKLAVFIAEMGWVWDKMA